MEPYITNDAVVFGILIVVLALIFVSSSSKHPFFVKLYTFVPPLLLCYFIPALLQYPLGLINGEVSGLYSMASKYLLPASLILLCVGIDFKGMWNLGPKALIIFLTGTVSVIVGGPFALFFVLKFAPGILPVEPEELWRGLSTIAGSWIGGGANQAAMKEIFAVSDTLFASMVVVDVIVANIWMGILLYGASITTKIDKWLKADNSAIAELKTKMENYQSSIAKNPTTTDIFILMGVAFGCVALAHFMTDNITPWMKNHSEWLDSVRLNTLYSDFFWLIVLVTTFGLLLSITKARKLEGLGASKWGSVFIYILFSTIGMKMNLKEIFSNLSLFSVGIVWMLVHIILIMVVARIIKAPFFYVAVGSQANIGGAASAPIVASAFSPALAPVGVLLAVLGYALGTYGGIICALLMQAVI
ncbi:MAG: DUF819 family protein [Saprospiraceae bacterium]|nr:DUF819 family protein [Saprospiraceae bacterium]